MIKLLVLTRLKPGTDPDEAWELWSTKYSVMAAKTMRPELKHYTINRVIKTIADQKTDIYGFAEQLYEDVESCERAFGRRLSNPGIRPPFDFERLIAEFREVPLL